MDRREFAAAGLTAGIALAAGSAFAQPGTRRGPEHHAHEAWEACARACSDCQRSCDSCATHCAHELAQGHKDHMTTLMTCRDCADFCATAAQITARGGPFAALICQSCAEACANCGRECAKFTDDPHMQRCAEECRKCEKACREMVAHAGRGPSR